MIELSLYLWGKPSWVLPLEGKRSIDPALIRQRGMKIKAHLSRVASIVQKLQTQGWKMAECYGSVYHLSFYHPEVQTLDAAQEQMTRLRIRQEDIELIEVEEG